MNDRSFSKGTSKIKSPSSYTNRRAFSCKWFILLFALQLLNIHVRGQYLNWDSKNALKKGHILFKSKYFFIFDNVDNFLFTIRRTLFKCSSNFEALFKSIINSLTVSLPPYILSLLLEFKVVQICFQR